MEQRRRNVLITPEFSNWNSKKINIPNNHLIIELEGGEL